MSCCGVTIEAHRNADLRKTYGPRNRNYTFAGFSPLMQIRDGLTVLLSISLSATANGSVFSVVSDALVLTIKKADIVPLSAGNEDRVLSYDIVLSQGGLEDWFLGGDFVALALNSAPTEGDSDVVVELGGEVVDVTISGGNIGVGASVLLADLNSAVESAEQSADDAAASLAAVPGLAATAGASAGTTAGASSGASAGATAGTDAANAVVATKANTSFNNVDPATGRAALSVLSSAQLSASSGLGLVGFQQTATGAVSRTALDKLRELVSPEDFGCVGNGTTNDTTNFQAALNSLTFGGVLRLSRGKNYSLTSVTVPAGVLIDGGSSYSSTITARNAASVLITLGVASGVHGVNFVAGVAQTSGSIYTRSISDAPTISDCQFNGYFRAVEIGAIPSTIVTKPRILNCAFRSPATGANSGAIDMINHVSGVIAFCVGSGAALPATQADFGIRCQSMDTLALVENNFTLHGKALLAAPPSGFTCYALSVTGGAYDSGGKNSAAQDCASAEFGSGGGSVKNAKISNVWFGLSVAQSGAYVTGDVDGIQFSGCEFPDNGDCGLIVVGSAVKNVSVTGGQGGGNAFAALRFAGATTEFTVTGFKAGNIAARGPDGRGIVVDAGASDNYLLVGNSLRGTSFGALTDGGTGINKVVANNLV